MIVTVDPVMIAVGAAATVAAAVIGSVYDFFRDRLLNRKKQQIRELAERIATDQICHYIDKDSMSGYDRKMADETKVLTEKILGEKPIEELSEMNGEKRLAKINELVQNLAQLYQIELKEVAVGELNPRLAGCYDREKKVIVLNSVYLMNSDKQYLREFLDTIYHEFRHAVQFQVIENIDKLQDTEAANFWAVSRKRAARWCRHHQDYEEAVKNPLEYIMNNLEVDARTFAYMCLDGVE